jgi:hypothetical protein
MVIEDDAMAAGVSFCLRALEETQVIFALVRTDVESVGNRGSSNGIAGPN